MKVQRFEVVTLDAKAAIRLDNGMLRAPVTLSRVGVFNYRNADGSTRRELRLPEEVFNKDSMASFELVPFLDEHPYAENGEVTAANARRLQIGSVGSVHQATTHLDGTVMVTDEAGVAKVLSGKLAVSCGYYCDRDFTPGVWEGQPYDCIQRNIRGNHVALVQVGRAGPEARIRLDADDAILFTLPQEQKQAMEKITVDAVALEMPAVSAAVVAKSLNDRDGKLTAQGATITKLTQDAADANKRADAAQALADSAKVELSKANDPAKFHAAVSERVALESKARGILGAEFKMDSQDAKAIKAACVAKLSPELTCDGKSDEYVNALFDHLSAGAKSVNPATLVVGSQVKGAAITTQDEGEDPFTAATRRFFNPEAK